MSDYGGPYVYQSSRSRVRAPSELREFPPYEDYIGKHPMVRDHLKLFAQAPWFDPIGITDRDLLNQYLVAGEYPGRVPAFAVGTFDWAHRCAVPLQAILKRGAAERHEPESAKEAHVRLVYQRLNRTVGTDIIPMPTSVFCHSDAHIQRLDVRECFHRGLRSGNGRTEPHTFMHWMCASKIPKFCNFWGQTSVGTNGVQAFHSKF